MRRASAVDKSFATPASSRRQKRGNASWFVSLSDFVVTSCAPVASWAVLDRISRDVARTGRPSPDWNRQPDPAQQFPKSQTAVASRRGSRLTLGLGLAPAPGPIWGLASSLLPESSGGATAYRVCTPSAS